MFIDCREVLQHTVSKKSQHKENEMGKLQETTTQTNNFEWRHYNNVRTMQKHSQ